MNNRTVSDDMLQQDQKNLVEKFVNKTQSEITAELLDPVMSGAFLNNVNPYLISQKEGKVTAIVSKSRYRIETEN